jgi:flavin reductase
MRRAAATVTVVTTGGPAGRLGLTVSSMCSVSADPPSLVVGIHSGSPVVTAIARNSCFAVNILEASQYEISEIFARRPAEMRRDHLESSAWNNLATGAPALDTAASTFDCHLVAHHVFGTHHLFIGLVVAVAHAERRPLIHHNRQYCALLPQAQAPDFADSEAALGALGWGI